MSLSTLSIRRPVLTIVFSIVIMLFGAIGFVQLGVREFPNVDPPIVNVNTSYTGANAEIIESQITEPLEEAINGIAGIRSISSTSRDGRSSISVEFDLSVDIEAAANDVRDKVSGSISRLPPEADPPTVAKADADANAIIALNIFSDKRSILELNAICETLVKERLQTIPGVSTVQVWGEKRYAMRLEINPSKLSSYGITPLDVRNALVRENVELPSGRIEGSNTELSIKTLGRMSTVQEFSDLIVKEDDNGVVRFKDVGEVRLAPENERTMLRRDGKMMVGYGIVPQPGSNQIAISDEFDKRLKQIKKDLPPDIVLKLGFDNTQYIRSSISEVQETIISAFVLVVIIIFVFLRDWRTTIIPVLAIPISLVGTFFLMYLVDFTVNVLTMLGVVLSIGMVVDDAIVVLENIYTKIEAGMSPKEAGIKGAEEIFFAVIATTIAIMAVFMPIIFLQGLTGRLFREFGLVVAGSVMISAFVALTLTTMLSAKLLKHRSKPTFIQRTTEPFFVWLNDMYQRSLYAFMDARWLAFPLVLLAIGTSYWFLKKIPAELAPMEDRSNIRVNATAPEGASFDYMDKYMMRLTDLIKTEVPESIGTITVTAPGFSGGGANSGFSRLVLSDRADRTRSQQEIANFLNNRLKELPEARAFALQSPTIGDQRGGLPVQYVLQAATLEKLKEYLPKFIAEAQKSKVFKVLDWNLKFTKPELRLTINRDKANNLGVSTVDIAQTLQLGLSGQRFGYFYMNGKQFQIIGEIKKEDRNTPVDLKGLYVKNRSGQLIQLDNLVTLNEESSPPQLYRYNRFSSATISASLAEGYTIGQGIDEMDRIAAVVLDESFTTDLAGQSKEFRDSSSSLYFAFMFALALIYLTLAAQFESFRDPLIIMFTVPLALFGALWSLWFYDQTMNIFSQIGIIMLIGLVTKNGILIVEFANQRKEEGLSKIDAVKEASVMRFRPILMTALSTILGILPIALALGAGSESRVSMGIAVVGGLVLSTFLTLYVIPAVYAYLSKDIKVQTFDTPEKHEVHEEAEVKTE